MGIEPSSTSLLVFYGSRESRKIKKQSLINHSLFLLYTLISKDEKNKNKNVEFGIEPSSTSLSGFQSSRGSGKIKKRSLISHSLVLLYTLILKDENKKNIVEGGNRTTVNAIVRDQSSRGSRMGGTVRKHRRVLRCPVASANERNRGARPPGLNWAHYLKKLQQILTVVRLPSNLRDNWSRNEQNEIFSSVSVGHVRLQLGPNIPHIRILPYTTQQAPMKLKLAEGVYNRTRWAIGQLLAPRAFG